jgi:DNA-binding PadR family transcriptional regulator
MSITKFDNRSRFLMNSTVRSLFLGIIKIHILHHAAQEPVFGLWFIDELGRHGYEISPGTLYPIFHSLEKNRLLKSYEEVVNGKVRKYYRATAKGRSTLKDAKVKVQELLNEMINDTTIKNSR